MKKQIFKRTVSTLIAIAMVIVMLPAIALPTFAETLSGTCGANVSWSLDTNTGILAISGTGNMLEYYSTDNIPWYNYKSLIKTVIIESGVTSIGDSAFYSCGSLTSITIPNSVTIIDNFAFYNCSSLSKMIYCGTEKEWNDIEKGSNWNSDVPATIQFHNYTDGVCSECGYECEHETVIDDVCAVCNKELSATILGDVSGDGDITNADVLMIYRLYTMPRSILSLLRSVTLTVMDTLQTLTFWLFTDISTIPSFIL